MLHNLQTLLLVKIVFLTLSLALPTNLICNGDFQGRTLSYIYMGEYYNIFPSNYSCWFNKNGGSIKYKHKLNPPVTTAAQLFIFSQYVLCQDVHLDVGKKYQFNFSLANSISMSYARILAKINDVEIMNLTSLGQYNVAHGSKIITANATTNRLCFQPNYVMDDPITYYFLGPCVDNVSIIEILAPPPPSPPQIVDNTPSNVSANTTINTTADIMTPINLNETRTNTSNLTLPVNQTNITSPFNSTSINSTNSTNTNTSIDSTNFTTPTPTLPKVPFPIDNLTQAGTGTGTGTGTDMTFEIYCITNKNQDLTFFTLDCTYENEKFIYFINQIKNIAQVLIDGEFQKNVEFTDIAISSMKIVIRLNRYYLLNQISIVISDQLAAAWFGLGYKFRFFIDGDAIKLLVLNNQETKVLQNIYPVAEVTIRFLNQVYLVLKVSFVSYFLLDIISFWNLSLMYNFLNISTVPLFSRYFFQKLQIVLFTLDSIIQWISKIFPQLKSAFDFDNTGGHEQMEVYKNEFLWFGAYGASTKYLSNNLEQIFMIGLLVLKIGLITLLSKIKFLPALIKKQLPDGLKKFKIFLNELVGIQIFMVISASKAIQNLGMEESQEKLNGILQVSTLFLCITILPLYLVTQGFIWQKKVQKKLQNKCQTIRSIPTLTKIQTRLSVRMSNKILASIYNVLQFLPFVVIPFLIVFDNPQLFLTFNTAILGYRFWFLCKYLRIFQFKLSEKIFQVLNLIVWVVYHSMYLVYWILEKVKQNYGWKNEAVVSECIKICGFVTIFTLILGGGFELIKFSIQILSFILKQIKKIIKKCNKSSVTPQPLNPNTAGEGTKIRREQNDDNTKKDDNGKEQISQKKVKLMVEIVNEANGFEANRKIGDIVVGQNRTQNQIKFKDADENTKTNCSRQRPRTAKKTTKSNRIAKPTVERIRKRQLCTNSTGA